MNKPEQLRLAADIIEKNLPYEYYNQVVKSWMTSSIDPGSLVCTNGVKIRLTPPPVELVPLTEVDVPPGSVIRSAPGHWSMVADLLDIGVKIGGRTAVINWHELKTCWAIKRPGQDWQPCSKPA